MSVWWLIVGCGNPSGPETPIVAEQLYNRYCARCHGLKGEGVPDQAGVQGRLNDPRVMKTRTDEQILTAIRSGRPPAMPAFGGEFTEAKIMVLAAYIRALSKRPTKSADSVDEAEPVSKSADDTSG